jgi:hypothetical protein
MGGQFAQAGEPERAVARGAGLDDDQAVGERACGEPGQAWGHEGERARAEKFAPDPPIALAGSDVNGAPR